MGLWDTIKQEAAVIRAAPLSVVTLMLASGVAGFGGAALLYSERFSALQAKHDALDARISLRDDQLEDVRRKLDERERATIRDELSGKQGRVTIRTSEPNGPLAQDLKAVFEESGWTVGFEPSSISQIMVTGDDAASSTAIRDAFNDAGVADLLSAGPVQRLERNGAAPTPFTPAPAQQQPPSGDFRHLD